MSAGVKVFLVGFWPDYEDFFFSNLFIKGFQFEVVNPLVVVERNVFSKNLPRYFKNKIFRKIITDLIKENPSSIFIFQEHRLILELLLESDSISNANILLRNSIRSNPKTIKLINGLKKNNYLVWSFDELDCDQFKLNHYKQMIRGYPDFSLTPIAHDFSFVGRDKGREEYLKSLKSSFEDNDLTMKINIRKNNKRDSICYEEYLTQICQARCVVDIAQKQQVGLSLRPLEAMMYKRKLITNNINVKKYSFYHPNNVYVVGDIYDVDDISDFMEKPYVDVPENIKEEYSVEKVIEQILSFDSAR